MPAVISIYIKRRNPRTAVSQGSVFHPPLLSRCFFPQRNNQISKLQNTDFLSLRGLVFRKCILKGLRMKRYEAWGLKDHRCSLSLRRPPRPAPTPLLNKVFLGRWGPP